MPPAVSHLMNWQAGWMLVLVGFAVGSGIGLGFARDEFLGGYTSLRRRMLRLGHIALVALGLLAKIVEGRGGQVDVSMHDVMLSQLNYLAGAWLNAGEHPQRMARSAHPYIVPAQVFENLREHLDERHIVELTATVAAYNCVSRFLEALQIDHD